MRGCLAIELHSWSQRMVRQGGSSHRVGDAEAAVQIAAALAEHVGNPFVVLSSCGSQLDVQWSYIEEPRTGVGVGCFA